VDSEREMILVVEDGDAVRTLVCDMLRQQGYEVMEARNGPDALKIWQQYADEIDLVVTDVLMPNMSGGELALQIASLRPETKVLFMSGYTGENILGDFERLEDLFLQKPFTASALAEKVRRVLEDPWEGLSGFRKPTAQTPQ
jgi:two-component system, cell cycle sensor histidine kinase and response regulator CckA